MNEETWNNILEQSLALFSQFGIRNISMDDIAKATGLSKKTIYQYVKDKDELIYKTFEFQLEKSCVITKDIISGHDNALEALIKITQWHADYVKLINPVAILEIQKYHPNVWTLMTKYTHESIIPNILKIITKGIDQGYFRNNMNIEVAAKLHVEKIHIIFNPSIFPHTKYNLHEVYYTAEDLFIRSIVTEKGLKYYIKHYSKNN